MCLSEMDANDNNVPATTNHVVPMVPSFVPTHVSHEEKPKSSMGMISRDGNKKCYSISLR